MKNNSLKEFLRKKRWLLTSIGLLCALGIFWGYKKSYTDTGLTLRETSFVMDTYHSKLNFAFTATYNGKKPEWWGEKYTLMKIKNFEFRKLNGQIIAAASSASSIEFDQKLRKLFSSPNGYFPTQMIYVSGGSITIPPGLSVDKGWVKADLQIVDIRKEHSPKVYAEYKVDMNANVVMKFNEKW